MSGLLPFRSTPRPCPQDLPNRSHPSPNYQSFSHASIDFSVHPDSLPHSELFPPGPPPPPRPNTDPRCNSVPSSSANLPRVQSRLVREAWRYHLRDYPDQRFVNSLLHIIDFGANLGFTRPHLAQSCRNLKSANNFPEFISKSVSDLLSGHHALAHLPLRLT